MLGDKEFESYKKFEYLTFEQLKLAVNFICGNLNSIGCYYPYWYDMYSYTSKSFLVMRWRKERGLTEVAKLGEAICENKIINFLNDKEHKCSCSSVYFNAVF